MVERETNPAGMTIRDATVVFTLSVAILIGAFFAATRQGAEDANHGAGKGTATRATSAPWHPPPLSPDAQDGFLEGPGIDMHKGSIQFPMPQPATEFQYDHLMRPVQQSGKRAAESAPELPK